MFSNLGSFFQCFLDYCMVHICAVYCETLVVAVTHMGSKVMLIEYTNMDGSLLWTAIEYLQVAQVRI